MKQNNTPDVSRDAAWREELRKSKSPKERSAIARVNLNELSGEYRVAHRL